MDKFTQTHLHNWVDQQFVEDSAKIESGMVEVYGSDPEYYNDAGWWRLYEHYMEAIELPFRKRAGS